MYKAQMRVQKLLCFLALAASVILFIYSLGLMTDLYDSLYPTMMNPKNIEETWVSGSPVYYHMQGFNKTLVALAVASVLLALFLFVTCTHSRRRYYLGNFVSTGLFAAAAAGISVFSMLRILAFREEYLQVDFEALQSFSEMWGTPYIRSTFWFDAGWFVFGLLLLAAVLLVANLIWKRKLMKEEAELLREGE